VKVARSAAATDPGRRRRHNEDAYVCEPPLFAVADGIGGAQAGEVASRLAATALRETGADGADPRRHVDALIQEANRRVYERQTSDASASGMGTTITVALLHDDMVWIGHVGDSRAYLVRNGELEQLTEDHSLVAELVRSGKLSPEEAETHPQRSVVTRALGTDPNVDVDTFDVQARAGDLYMLCSDGLTTMVDDSTILEEIDRNRDDLKSAAKALVRAANRGGGEDNITVVFFELGTEQEHADEQTVALPPPREQLGDEEDTLDEVDGVKPIAVQEEASRPRRRDERHPVRRGLLFVALLCVAMIACAFAVWGLWRSHFVGAEADGHVAVYQGVPWNVVGNVRLYRTVYVSPLLTAQLSRQERKKLFDHNLVTESSALSEVHRYEQEIGR
jgi:serine/threonine protein phosphatase PrpC